MWFNFDSGICDDPKNVYCQINDNRPSNAKEGQNADEFQAEEDKANIWCSRNIDSQVIKFISSKLNCGRYYICYHGKAIQQQCNDNLQWNANESKCDHKSNVRCEVINQEKCQK